MTAKIFSLQEAREKKRAEAHERAPICAEFVRQMREVFGEDQVKVIYVKEGEVQLGEPFGDN